MLLIKLNGSMYFKSNTKTIELFFKHNHKWFCLKLSEKSCKDLKFVLDSLYYPESKLKQVDSHQIQQHCNNKMLDKN